jgi:hypothetical protein
MRAQVVLADFLESVATRLIVRKLSAQFLV